MTRCPLLGLVAFVAAAILYGTPVVAAGAEAVPPEPCSDLEDVIETALTGRALQGGQIMARALRKAGSPDTAIVGITITVDGDVVAQIPAPDPGLPAETTIDLPVSRSAVVRFTWSQSPSMADPDGCPGIDSYRVRAFVGPSALAAYLRRTLVAQHAWELGARRFAECVEPIDTGRPETLIPAAQCLDQARRADRSAAIYRRTTAPPGLQAAHRGLFESAALRSRRILVSANTLRRAEAVLRGRSFNLRDPVFPEGIQRRRALWRQAVVREARSGGGGVPQWVRRVGT